MHRGRPSLHSSFQCGRFAFLSTLLAPRMHARTRCHHVRYVSTDLRRCYVCARTHIKKKPKKPALPTVAKYCSSYTDAICLCSPGLCPLLHISPTPLSQDRQRARPPPPKHRLLPLLLLRAARIPQSDACAHPRGLSLMTHIRIGIALSCPRARARAEGVSPGTQPPGWRQPAV